MNSKKIVIKGKGTAGAQAMAHMAKWFPNCELSWYYDPSIPTQTVGEGSVLTLGSNMFQNLNFSHEDIIKVDGTFKTGVYKEGWGASGKEFFHDFPPPLISYHFNAVKLQDYIFNKLKDKVNIVEGNFDNKDIDADYIMDCSGKPKDLSKFNIPDYIPVNSVFVNQCLWEYPAFQHTKAIARPYGWVFMIPLQNRCSVGYLYNNKINSIDDIKEDIQQVIKKYKLTPSESTNSFTFGNYVRKVNFEDRVVYNGNASFFLEPLEATSIGLMHYIQRLAFDLWSGNIDINFCNQSYLNFVSQTENIIMMHYFAGSKYKSEFWDFAQERGEKCMKEAIQKDDYFKYMVNTSKQISSLGDCNQYKEEEYSVWWLGSFLQNITGLDIKNKLK